MAVLSVPRISATSGQTPIRQTSHMSLISKQPVRSILEEEAERIVAEVSMEEAHETDYCIKGYDF